MDNKVIEYIKSHWKETIREPNERVPYPFTSPCITDFYKDFFYWDSYFINKGLLLSGLEEQALNNIRNMDYLIKKMGYVPNATSLLDRSQPPVFTLCVWDYYKKINNKEVLKEFLPSILNEYNFWMSKRMTPIGLNAYGHSATKEELLFNYNGLADRVYTHGNTVEEKLVIAADILAIAESGLDFNMRFRNERSLISAHEFAHLDLNCFLYKVEQTISKIYNELSDVENSKLFLSKSYARKELMDKYFLTEEGIYLDYNFITGEHSKYLTAVSLYPMYFGVSNDLKSTLKVLSMLEMECGVSVAPFREDKLFFQWDYPVLWGETNYIAYYALKNVGALDDANRIKTKYMNVIEKNFEATNLLWEKYDVRDGSIMNVEYDAPPFMGWTASTYQCFCEEE